MNEILEKNQEDTFIGSTEKSKTAEFASCVVLFFAVFCVGMSGYTLVKAYNNAQSYA